MFFGIFIYVLGIISVMIFDKNISVISIIGGTVVEVIAGLFFWLYREATSSLVFIIKDWDLQKNI